MKVEGFAAFCNALVLHLAIIGLENQFLVFLRMAVLDRFYCILGKGNQNCAKCTRLFPELT